MIIKLDSQYIYIWSKNICNRNGIIENILEKITEECENLNKNELDTAKFPSDKLFHNINIKTVDFLLKMANCNFEVKFSKFLINCI